MSSPYVGEIRLVGFTFAPVNWSLCNGSLLPISQFEVLYTLLGTTYGGDGVNTFGLPDLRGRVPIHVGKGFVQGELAGSESVTLLQTQLPPHNHPLGVSNTAATATAPATASLATTANATYVQPGTQVPMTTTTTAAGGNQPHENMQPFLTVSFIISLAGIFPSQG